MTFQFNCKDVAHVASDMLLLLCDHAEELKKNYSDLSRTVIEVCYISCQQFSTFLLFSQTDKSHGKMLEVSRMLNNLSIVLQFLLLTSDKTLYLRIVTFAFLF
jgi:hypothetical protein